MFEPMSAPPRVPMFQLAYKMGADTQNAVRRTVSSCSAATSAVVSSMTHCAPSKRTGSELLRKTGANANPYTALRLASRTAPPNALAALPPDARTLTADICDAPVKTNNDITHACATDAPAATASTPNDIPKTTKATPMMSEAFTNRRASGARK